MFRTGDFTSLRRFLAGTGFNERYGDFATVWCYSRFLRTFSNSMTAATRLFWKTFLHGLAWILFAIAGLAFWVGGRAISEFGKIDRILAEMLGLGIAFASGALGYILKTTA